ncbi:hypothetical protein BGZ51_009763 [Haplosporangium sp. Z 767]|nr:hypothetical protein BGZ51_009763 [Haplosporangium sp. Z 767]KAF9193490.1 hypothetical protein BGZ50_007420 [Haplosporangium sp. Z 11]
MNRLVLLAIACCFLFVLDPVHSKPLSPKDSPFVLSVAASTPSTKLTSSTKQSGSVMQPSLASGLDKSNPAIGTSELTRVEVGKKRSERVTHMYSRAYEAILNSESQLPVFLHHPLPDSVSGDKKKQVSTPDSERVKGGGKLVVDVPPKNKREVDDSKQGLSNSLDQQQQQLQREQQQEQQSPQLQSTQSQEEMPKKVSSFNSQAMAEAMRGPFEDGVSTVKTPFDKVFGPEALRSEFYINSISGAVQQTDGLHNDATVAAKIDVAAISNPTLDDIARQNDKASAATASSFASSQDKEFVVNRQANQDVVTSNDHENTVEDNHIIDFDHAIGDDDQDIDDGDDHCHHHQQQHVIMDSLNESDDALAPFLLRNPTSSFSGFSDVPVIGWLQSESIFHRTTVLLALVMSGALVLLLVVSYMMYVRRKNTSPLAFFQYLIAGIITSPLRKSSAMSQSTVFSFSKSPSTPVDRQSSWPGGTEPSMKSRWSFGFGNGTGFKSGPLLPEPVVASSTSSSKSKTSPALMEMRRTSASQYHLQQQVLAAQTHVDL